MPSRPSVHSGSNKGLSMAPREVAFDPSRSPKNRARESSGAEPASRRWPKGAAFTALQPIHLAFHAGALDVVHTALHGVFSP